MNMGLKTLYRMEIFTKHLREQNRTIIYGASDDLIEIDGVIRNEVGCYDHKRPIKITASDGTIANIFYNGEWIIHIKNSGTGFIEKINSVGDEGMHIGHETVTSYSDILVLHGVEWIKIKGQVLKIA
jgi:hypothetical protein